ncbi:MAG: PIN domain-containing protein, partial [Pirellulales bacterium]|nr:PIN domain-containing protein [Pirellulales bacterium]
MTEAQPKLFVLDTNVILHDSGCIRNFEENDVAIPITVLEELDRFKRGNEDIHFQAREFLRRIDALTGDVLSATGSPLGEGLGSIRVVLGGSSEDRHRDSFLQDTPDPRILWTAVALQEQLAPRPVILVSKDTNLRMKAKSHGLPAQDYTSDKVKGFDTLYTGKRTVEGIASEVIDHLYANGGVLPLEQLPLEQPPVANENFVLRNGSKSALATFHREAAAFHRVEKQACYGITPRNAEQSFALRALSDDSIKLVTLAGTAGT